MSERRKFMHEDGYPCAPVNVRDDFWFYVDSKGLHIITSQIGGVGHVTWAMIRRALDDHKKAPGRRKRRPA
jgi:hypothetical protein